MAQQDLIRNFCIISHIDHGKSTLADRFLEITKTVPREKLGEQYLDQNPISRERGITIKLAPVRMNYTLNADNLAQKGASSAYTLNLIDTPGHVDFSYEVSRSLACVEGAILLVDATKGIQAQTIGNFNHAKAQNLTIIPVVNKIDLPNAQIEKTAQELVETFGFEKEEILFVSGKTGENIKQLLEEVIKRVPPPKGGFEQRLQALVFDSQYDKFRGVVLFVRLFNGALTKNQELILLGSRALTQSLEVGLFIPDLKPTDKLWAGEIGYVATGLKDVSLARAGDTLTFSKAPTENPLPGYQEPKPLVFASFYPLDTADFPLLRDALLKLKLNDASLSFEGEQSQTLGSGFRAGFLGALHLEVVKERLEREYGLSLLVSTPTVKYKVITINGQEISVSQPAKLPPSAMIKTILEPCVLGTVIAPKEFVGGLLTLLSKRRGKVKEHFYQEEKVFLKAELPLAEIITDFYSRLKDISSGFATFNYEVKDFSPVEAVKLDILVSGERVDPLSQIIVKEKADFIGRKLVTKIKELIPRQQFEISVQAVIGAKVISRANISPFRKDVTSKLYGGDRTRKDKLLEAQKKGKKRMKMVGRVEIPQEVFFALSGNPD